MAKAKRLSITNRATSKDALSRIDELHVHDQINDSLRTATALVFTVQLALQSDAFPADDPAVSAASVSLFRAWEQLGKVAEEVDRLDAARMWRVKSESEKANA